MPVYIRKGAMHIPSPSEKDWSKMEEEDYYLKDPDQALDCLPQPYRMIGKIVNRIFDQSWEKIQAREECREAERLKRKATAYQPTDEIKFYGRANCITTCGAESLIFVGLTSGLAVFRVARLFYFTCDHISLVKVINDLEDISKRTICMNLGICQGGEYAGILLQGSGETWLDVYRLPKDTWLKEVEHSYVAKTQKVSELNCDEKSETVVSVETKLTPPALIMKIKPPRPLAGSHFKSASEALQKTEESSVIGSGLNHVISAQQWDQQEAIFCNLFRKYLEVKSPDGTEEKKSNDAVFYFLFPGKILQMGSDSKSQTGTPNAISVHWSDRHLLYWYFLVRPHKEKSESEPKPDAVWPCAAPVVCSAATSCTSYLALGFEDGAITIWDIKHSGFPLALVMLPEGCHMQDIYFLEFSDISRNQMQFPSMPTKPRVRILAWCTSGSLYLITAAGGKETTVTLLRDSPKTADDLISAVLPIPTLPSAVLLISREGSVELFDTAEREVVCRFVVPVTHKVALPWQPVFALDPVDLCLFLRGDERLPGKQAVHASDVPSAVFCFSFEGLAFMEKFRTRQESVQTPFRFLPWDKRCELFLQNRYENQMERCKQLPDCWKQLQKHAEKKERHRK
ncbi:WD repeat-containing protein 93 isoform X2 [Rhinatrema bivittatum]|uniref:WD repeat-containing protein 93 isoform X2 n=1 Tax=Rhinatrema bivittatum TaxID=194408 RepID=UPI00112E5333|nr:WD repeat-containing protein 93 isoform X2 [Rhinatrema bivittatum]